MYTPPQDASSMKYRKEPDGAAHTGLGLQDNKTSKTEKKRKLITKEWTDTFCMRRCDSLPLYRSMQRHLGGFVLRSETEAIY